MDSEEHSDAVHGGGGDALFTREELELVLEHHDQGASVVEDPEVAHRLLTDILASGDDGAE